MDPWRIWLQSISKVFLSKFIAESSVEFLKEKIRGSFSLGVGGWGCLIENLPLTWSHYPFSFRLDQEVLSSQILNIKKRLKFRIFNFKKKKMLLVDLSVFVCRIWNLFLKNVLWQWRGIFLIFWLCPFTMHVNVECIWIYKLYTLYIPSLNFSSNPQETQLEWILRNECGIKVLWNRKICWSTN